ncbi:MAG: helix-turn-helix transcriptional regulator [Oscillibacter sp.]|nr:helix-turn-helix transcriptional regulator [Oscillibacter sp.]
MDVFVTAARIKSLCKERKLTVKGLLEQTNINRNFIYDLEKGGQIPSADKLERIANCLDCSVDYLLGRTDIPEVNKQA